MSANEEPKTNSKTKTLALATDLYTKNRRHLLAIATRNSPTPQDAEEALQDTFALFIDHFDPESKAPPLAWITLTLKRRCWAAARTQLRLQPENQTEPHKHQTSDIELIELSEKTTQLRNAFLNLKPQERRALSLLAIGYSYHEIAQLTGWTYTKVNRCITEGRANLRTTTNKT